MESSRRKEAKEGQEEGRVRRRRERIGYQYESRMELTYIYIMLEIYGCDFPSSL